jgi:hypothetical protein
MVKSALFATGIVGHDMPTIHLHYGPGLTREQANACYRDGQKRWWIGRVSTNVRKRIANDDFVGYAPVEVQEYIKCSLGPATYPLSATLELDFGCYVLGCGTGRSGLRKFFQVDICGVKWL